VRNLLIVLSVLVAFLFCGARPASAYLDPASGSLIFQVVAAAIALGLVFVRSFWTKIRSLFGVPSSKPDNIEDEDQP